MRVLLVEDDPSISDPLTAGLRRYSYEVQQVTTGADALAADLPDVVLLDLGLPDMDGLDVCREIRETSTVPIVVITARDDEIDTAAGLEVGADDYVSKPFGVREIIARIRAVMRRTGARSDARMNLLDATLTAWIVEGADVFDARGLAGFCAEHGLSRSTANRHAVRIRERGRWELDSRRPRSSPARTPDAVEAHIIALWAQLGRDNGATTSATS